MNKTVIALIGALLLFSISAGASWFLQQPTSNPDAAPKAAGEGHERPGRHEPPAPKTAAHGSAGETGESSRPAIRPPQVPDAEYLSKVAVDLQQQSEAVRRQEQQLAARQKTFDLLYQEIRKEHKSLESVRKQVEDEMRLLADKADAVDRKMAEARQQGVRTAEQSKEYRQTLTEVDDAERGRIKQMANVYDTMDTEAAAQTIQEMVDSGKLDMAVKILAHMRERQAARVLAQLPGNGIAVQILDRLKGLKGPATK